MNTESYTLATLPEGATSFCIVTAYDATRAESPYSNEVAMLVSTPVHITANTIYVASYFAPKRHYSDNYDYFATVSATNGPPRVLRSGNGLFVDSSGAAFPNGSFQSTNYWVDVIFKPSN